MEAGTSYGSCFFTPTFLAPATTALICETPSFCNKFVRNVHRDRIDRTMVEAINKIGQEMGIQTIAEFVENDAIKEELKKINVDFVQGFGIEHPVPINESTVAAKVEPQLILAAQG